MGTSGAGDSPITETPYKQDADGGGGDEIIPWDAMGGGKKKGAGWKKALSIGIGALTGGLDAVYGTGKIMPKSSDRLKKKKKTTEE